MQILEFNPLRKGLILSNHGANFLTVTPSNPATISIGVRLDAVATSATARLALAGDDWRGWIQGPLFAIADTAAVDLGIIEVI